jgi:hypothetical protein
VIQKDFLLLQCSECSHILEDDKVHHVMLPHATEG